jgi:RND superfamily putative drug exporter
MSFSTPTEGVTMDRTGIASRAARWSAKHRRAAILGWIAFVVVSFGLGGMAGTQLIADEDLGNGESRQGEQILADAGFPETADEEVMIQSRGDMRAGDPEFDAAIRDVEARLSQVAHVTAIKSPLAPHNGQQISSDGRTALVYFEIKGDDDQTAERVEPALAAVSGAQDANPELRIEQFGDASLEKAITESFEEDFQRAETLSLPITLLILVLAFGALAAAGVPLLLALTAVAATLGLLGPVSQLFPVDEAISSVILLVGLAVGVDYSMFYLRRARAERRAGHSNEAALEIAAATSGRAVLVSGLTVMIAMAGMFLTGNATFMSFAIGTILVVAVAVLGSLTVLPAVISKLGDKVEKGRVPLVGRLHRLSDGESRVWSAILDRVLRRPLVAAVLATAALVALSIPAFHMDTKDAGADGVPQDLAVVKTYDRIQEAFPGEPLPAVVVVHGEVTGSEAAGAVREFRAQAIETGLMNDPIDVTVNDRGDVAVVTVPMEGTGTDDRSIRALETLREDVIPSTLGQLDGTEAYVTGMTAGSEDFNEQMSSSAPLVFAFVLGLAFVLLMVTFRSIVIPLKAIVLNLLSVGAAYGVLVWVFQDGHLESLLDFESNGGITSWLPLFLFVLLFGLSMDYHVFILSRIQEAFKRGMSTSDAVADGIKSTAGVVTSAAVVMIAVFSVFATLGALDFKQMGVGLAVAILIDATIVRAVLLPATMTLLGDRNWYLPSWLGWLPNVGREPEPEGAAA